MDWAGQSLPIYNADTGKTSKAYLFVGTLSYRQYSYVKVTANMKQESWINAHINMFHYFKIVTTLLICDNLKTGVIKHPRYRPKLETSRRLRPCSGIARSQSVNR